MYYVFISTSRLPIITGLHNHRNGVSSSEYSQIKEKKIDSYIYTFTQTYVLYMYVKRTLLRHNVNDDLPK